MKPLIASALILSLAAPAHAGGEPNKHSIVDTAVAAGQFKTLAAALGAANLVDTLQGEGPFTVFAPTDEAFAKLPKKTLQALLREENRDQLAAILTLHVVSGVVRAENVVKLKRAGTVNGQSLPIEVAGKKVRIGNATLLQADIECSNGVIHVIDTVLLPIEDNLVEVAQKAGSFNTLLAAAKAAGLADALTEGPFTVFAPTDEAFAKIPELTLKSLLERKNRKTLANILQYHIVPGRVFASDAIQAGKAPALQKDQLSFDIEGGSLRVNDAKVLANDIQASNGVIHVIDSVLMPPQPEQPRGPKFFGLSYERPSAALAAQLGITRSASLVVTRVVDGSQAEAAGLKRYDVLTEVGGMKATDKNVSKAKRDGDYGDTVEFQIIRAGKFRKLDIPIGEQKH